MFLSRLSCQCHTWAQAEQQMHLEPALSSSSLQKLQAREQKCFILSDEVTSKHEESPPAAEHRG